MTARVFLLRVAELRQRKFALSKAAQATKLAGFALLPRVKMLAHRTRNFMRCRVLRPLLRLLRKGVSPKRLAWSLAVAVVVGINPFLGLTTVSMILLAWIFKLNHVATQIGIHVVSPLQWLLFLPFIHIGIVLFRTHRLPLSREADPPSGATSIQLQLLHLLWLWEWHALIVWAALAAVLAPLMAMQIRRTLVLSGAAA